MNMQSFINQNNAIHARFMASEFRMLSRDGKTTGGSDKTPISKSTKVGCGPKAACKQPGYKSRKAAQRLKNKAARADLNREISTGKVPDGYHSTLSALSKGTH
jgi:hypothetical protein